MKRKTAAERMSGMSGRLHGVNCCKSCWYRGLMVMIGIAWRRPDKTGHFRTLGQCRLPMAAMREKTATAGGTPNVNSEGAIRMSMSNRPGLTPGQEGLRGKAEC